MTEFWTIVAAVIVALVIVAMIDISISLLISAIDTTKKK